MLKLDTKTLKDHAKILNRTTEADGYPAFEWTASGFELNFVGDRIFIKFEKPKTLHTAYIAVFIDGVRRDFAINDGSEVFKAVDLEDREHKLRLVKITEARRDNHDNRIALTELNIGGENPEILPPPAENKIKMAFFGDSITCGYGVWGENEAIDFNSRYEDATKSYAYLTAQAFNADYQIVSQSGQGIVCNSSGEVGYRTSEYFEHTSAFSREKYDHTSFTPDIVVFNIGTNDCVGGANAEQFKKNGLELMKRAREVYKNAEIIWMFGMMGGGLYGEIGEVIAELRKEDLHFHHLQVRDIYHDTSEIGSSWHPNFKGHQRSAQNLIDFIEQNTEFKRN